MELILTYKPNPDVKNNKGLTAYILAKKYEMAVGRLVTGCRLHSQHV